MTPQPRSSPEIKLETGRDYINFVLNRARKGVYRSELLTLFPGVSQSFVKFVIREAKKFYGLYSVPDMRGLDGDTWYQYDGE